MQPALPPFPSASFHALAEEVKRAAAIPFALQIGAMDGKRFDLLHPHLVKGGWRGLLVEPVADMFAELKKTYAAHPELELANCAVADYDGTLALYRIDPAMIAGGMVPEEALGVTSAFPERGVLGGALKRNYPAIAQDYVRKVEVPCRTLPRLLRDHKVRAIDLFMIDTEGADWLIVRQLDLDRFRPALICLEYSNLSGEEMHDCCMHFQAKGYQFALCAEDNQNLLFHRSV